MFECTTKMDYKVYLLVPARVNQVLQSTKVTTFYTALGNLTAPLLLVFANLHLEFEACCCLWTRTAIQPT